MEVTLEKMDWGFVVSELVARNPDWVCVVAEGMSCTPIQFCRVLLRDEDTGDRHDLLVLSESTVPSSDSDRSIANAALVEEYPDAVRVPLTASRVGYAEGPPVRARGEAVASAVAMSLASGAWDESDPFEVVVGGESYRVRARYDGEAWRATAVRLDARTEHA